VWRVQGVLQSWRLISPRASLEDERNPPELTAEELRQDFASLEEAVPAINEAIDEQQALLGQLFGDEETPELTASQSEWVEYFEEHYADALLTLEHEVVLQQCLHQHAWQCADAEKPLDPDAVRLSIRYATGLRSIRKIRALENALKKMDDIRLLLRVATPHAEINILRQGFILLMTAFDAAVFELVRVKLRNGFFSLIGMFGKQEKVSLQEISQAGSFDDFRDEIIEDQMKKRYVKDLLIILDTLGLKCSDEPAGDSFGHLIELVLRRNVHVHNRGLAPAHALPSSPCAVTSSPGCSRPRLIVSWWIGWYRFAAPARKTPTGWRPTMPTPTRFVRPELTLTA